MQKTHPLSGPTKPSSSTKPQGLGKLGGPKMCEFLYGEEEMENILPQGGGIPAPCLGLGSSPTSVVRKQKRKQEVQDAKDLGVRKQS